jgi:hypothetical protein
MERKVKFRLEKVYSEELGVWECVVHRQGMGTQRVGVARKDIALVAIVANTMSCVFDNVELRENDNIEFEITAKINWK